MSSPRHGSRWGRERHQSDGPALVVAALLSLVLLLPLVPRAWATHLNSGEGSASRINAVIADDVEIAACDEDGERRA